MPWLQDNFKVIRPEFEAGWQRAPADLPYALQMLVLVEEQFLASGDEGQWTVAAQKEPSSEPSSGLS